METVNIVTIKWGNYLMPKEYNILFNAIKRNTTFNIKFYCFTDNSEGLDKEIITKPLPKFNTTKQSEIKYAYQKEAGLCDDNLEGLKGERVFFFDYDTIILDNLDDVFNIPKGDEFWILRDFVNKKYDKTVGQASFYSWRVGTLGWIKEEFEKDPKKIIDKYYTASQEYLSGMVFKKYGYLNYFPDYVCASFKTHCVPKFFLFRFFLVPKFPKGYKMLTFHGRPKIQDAIDGQWPEKNLFKKIYKKILPAKWIEKYYY